VLGRYWSPLPASTILEGAQYQQSDCKHPVNAAVAAKVVVVSFGGQGDHWKVSTTSTVEK
jgi:hypothetical protein